MKTKTMTTSQNTKTPLDDAFNCVFKRAVICNDIPKIKEFIAIDIDVNHADNDGIHPLSRATSAEAVSLLVKAGAKLENDGVSILSEYCRHNVHHKPEVYEALIKAGADVNARDKDGRTPIMHSVMNGNVGGFMVKTLIDNGADINATDDKGRTALMYVSNEAGAYVLIKNGIDIDKKDNSGKTAVSYLVSKCHIDFNKDGEVEDRIDAINTMIRNGAKVSKRTTDFLDDYNDCMDKINKGIMEEELMDDAFDTEMNEQEGDLL